MAENYTLTKTGPTKIEEPTPQLRYVQRHENVMGHSASGEYCAVGSKIVNVLQQRWRITTLNARRQPDFIHGEWRDVPVEYEE